MKLLHTSDWHLGRTLYGRRRYAEFTALLEWLHGVIVEQHVEALLVAGDVFDTTTPSNQAQQLYYRFLAGLGRTACRHVVVIAGNHDSATFLNAPRELLRALNVHVVGSATDNLQDEVLLLSDQHGEAELIVCAVPFLRDRDLRHVEAGESSDDKLSKLLLGIQQHYAAVTQLALEQRAALDARVPLVGMGHLFAAGGKTTMDDGVRELYVGTLAQVPADHFGSEFDYLALGHLHAPQLVAGNPRMRYSGAPLSLGFGEARQRKSVCLVELTDNQVQVEQLEVPVFQRLVRLCGDWSSIEAQVLALKQAEAEVWLEVEYTGAEVVGDLRERVASLLEDSTLEVLRLKNNRVREQVLQQMEAGETLDNLEPHEVFERCLNAHAIAAEQRAALLATYQEAVLRLTEDETAVVES